MKIRHPGNEVDEGPAQAAIVALAAALAPHLRLLLGATPDERVDVLQAVPGPRRATLAACRSGKIEGVAKIGRRWIAPRASVDAWLRTLGPRLLPSPVDADEDAELEELSRAIAREPRGRAKR